MREEIHIELAGINEETTAIAKTITSQFKELV